MALPAPGNPISANMINVEANRTGTTYAPLSVNAIPVTTSLIGLYVDSGVNQVAPHAYSEFYSKSFTIPPSPYWMVNTTNTPSIGKQYVLSGSSIIQNNSAPLPTTYNTNINEVTGFSVNGAGSLTINDNENLVIGCSLYDGSTDHKPLVTLHDATTGLPDTSTAYNWNAPNHYISDLEYIDGFDDKVFWVDQEDSNDADPHTDRRRYGVVSINSTVYNSNTYPKLWQYTGWTRRIDNSTYQTGFTYSAPKVATLNGGNVDSLNNSNKAYVYIINSVYADTSGSVRQQRFNGAIVRLTYDNTTATGVSVCLTSPIFKVWKNNVGSGPFAPINKTDPTSFRDITIVKSAYQQIQP